MIEVVKDIAREAGSAVLEVYGTEFGVETKEDSSQIWIHIFFRFLWADKL